MISVDIISANNPNFLGNYEFSKNLIYVGSNHQSDIYCPKSNLSDIHFFIEIIEQKLILHLNKKVEHVLVNSKRTTQFKNIKIGDVIEIDNIQFKIKDFKYETNITKKEKLNEIVANLQSTNPELLDIISSLSK